jgi:transcriptional regulator with XRE-family HTH domain
MSSMKDIMLRSAEQLGSAIRLKRKEKGLSQSALAAHLGVERKWVLRLEAGNPKAEFALVLKALAVVGLGVLLRDSDRSATSSRPEPSRLDEVFARLQRRDTK